MVLIGFVLYVFVVLSGMSKSKKKQTSVAVDLMSSVTGLGKCVSRKKNVWSEQSGFQKKSQVCIFFKIPLSSCFE